MDYILAKQLKDAGFEQNGKGEYFEIGGGLPIAYKGEKVVSGKYYLPTLEELIDICGSHFSNLDYGYLSGTFRAYGFSDLSEGRSDEVSSDWCTTPTEAVAILWLKLHK